MNVVVDTSVWSAALRRGAPRDETRLHALTGLLNQGRVVLLGVVLQEILQGIRDANRFQEIKERLDALPLIDLTREDYIEAASIWNTCRSNGVQASTVDCQIAAACARHNCSLLTADKDFESIARHYPLHLL